ncbi:MAG: hypothetical protein ACQESA_03580, partial [Patescibacteria group bacterium]
MENFEKRSKGEEMLSQIFSSQEELRESLKVALDWSNNGGPEVGSFSFIKAVVGDIKMEGDDYNSIKREIKKEVAKIKKDNGEAAKKKKLVVQDLDEGGKTFSKKEIEKMVASSRKQILRESKRVGEEPDMNELYPHDQR